MALERGIVVSCDTVRRRAMMFGWDYARRLKRKKPRPHDIWLLDEVVISIGGESIGCGAISTRIAINSMKSQTRRNTGAARRLLRRLRP